MASITTSLKALQKMQRSKRTARKATVGPTGDGMGINLGIGGIGINSDGNLAINIGKGSLKIGADTGGGFNVETPLGDIDYNADGSGSIESPLGIAKMEVEKKGCVYIKRTYIAGTLVDTEYQQIPDCTEEPPDSPDPDQPKHPDNPKPVTEIPPVDTKPSSELAGGVISVPRKGYGLYAFAIWSDYTYIQQSHFSGNAYESSSAVVPAGFKPKTVDGRKGYMFSSSMSIQNIYQNRPDLNKTKVQPVEWITYETSIIGASNEDLIEQLAKKSKLFTIGPAKDNPNAQIIKGDLAYDPGFANTYLGNSQVGALILKGTSDEISDNFTKYVNSSYSSHEYWNSSMYYIDRLGIPASYSKSISRQIVYLGFLPYPTPDETEPEKPKPPIEKPPPPKPKMSNCCKDAKVDLARVEEALERLEQVLATREILNDEKGYAVPNKMLIPGGNGYSFTKNYLGIFTWLFATIDRYGFDGPIIVDIPDVNKDKEGNQQLKIQVNSLSTAIQTLLSLAVENKGDQASRLNIQVRLAFMLTRMMRMIHKMYYLIVSILEGIGVPTIKKRIKDIPFEFNLNPDDLGFGEKAEKLDTMNEDDLEAQLPKLLDTKTMDLIVEVAKPGQLDIRGFLIKLINKN